MRAAQLHPTLAAEYAKLEAEIGHRFRNDLSMAEIITICGQGPPLRSDHDRAKPSHTRHDRARFRVRLHYMGARQKGIN